MKKLLSSVIALGIAVNMTGISNAGGLADLGLKEAIRINSSPVYDVPSEPVVVPEEDNISYKIMRFLNSGFKLGENVYAEAREKNRVNASRHVKETKIDDKKEIKYKIPTTVAQSSYGNLQPSQEVIDEVKDFSGKLDKVGASFKSFFTKIKNVSISALAKIGYVTEKVAFGSNEVKISRGINSNLTAVEQEAYKFNDIEYDFQQKRDSYVRTGIKVVAGVSTTVVTSALFYKEIRYFLGWDTLDYQLSRMDPCVRQDLARELIIILQKRDEAIRQQNI